MIARVTAWLQHTFAALRGHPRLALALAVAIVAVIVSPIPPFP